jgi:hypothetical protein
MAIELHPAQATVTELVRWVAQNPGDFAERDQIERAVFELAGIGLLHRHDFLNRPDSLVIPTPAALRAHALISTELHKPAEEA